MAKDTRLFLEILNGYFAQSKEDEGAGQTESEQSTQGAKQKVTIPMEYLFTEKLDRAVIESAFINLICRADKSYRGKMNYDPDHYRKISSLDIETTDAGTNLVINARDGWTKVVITGDKNLRGPFWATSEDKLYEEILREFDRYSVKEMSREKKLTRSAKETFISNLRDPEIKSQRKDYIISVMANAADNLIEYYKYMMKQKGRHEGESLEGAIQQRVGKGFRGGKTGKTREPRKSEIYDFDQRAQILEEMQPDQTIVIDKIEEDNTVSKFAYTTYVYKNPRDRQGYLLVAEPFEGNHNTRMRFVPQAEYDALHVIKGKNKLVHLTEKFLEMSDSEFTGSKFSKKFKHTSIESLRTRYRRVVLGERMPTDAEETRYKETDRILYDGEIKLTKDNIREWIQSRRVSQVSQARGQLYGRLKEENIMSIPQ